MALRKLVVIKVVCLAFSLSLFFTGLGLSQEINLDKMKKAGDLVCYPSLKDPALWYYLPDQPRLAVKDGKPQFSFMKYARTSETGKAGTHTAEGGGIVHFLVTYGAGKDRVREAERRLQEEFPDARIEGPIVYRKGSFALITSFKEGQENLVRTVAVGKAPLMEGQKAAVSMALSRQGAELLWESFKSDTPDISLVFDMEFAGIREPYEATIEADWSRVSKHKRLKAGFKYSWFGADVDMLFQELRQDGAIKITTKGENASMDKIIQSANAKLLQVMFDPAPVDDLTRATAEKDSYSSLNQAMKMLKDSQRTSGRSSSLNDQRNFMDLNSPGFKQMMASVIQYIIPEAHASAGTSVQSTSGDLNTEQRQQLRRLFEQGVELKESGNFSEALEKFRECLRLHEELTGRPLPGGNTRYNIGHCLFGLGRYAQSADYFTRAADMFGRDSVDGRHSLERASEARMRAQGESGGEGQPQTGSGSDTAQTGTDTPREDRAQPRNEDTQEREADRTADRVMPASASEDYNRARRLDNTARQNGYRPADTRAAIQAYESYLGNHSAQGQRKTEIEGRIRSLRRRLPASEGEDASALQTTPSDRKEVQKILDTPPGSSSSVTSSSGSASSGSSSSSTSSSGRTTGGSASSGSGSAAGSTSSGSSGSTASTTAARPASGTTSAAAQRAADKQPGFSLVASFQMKNIKRSGKMVYHMNHYRSEKQSFTMAENIGSLYSRYGNDSRIFRALTIDDPVFKQREVLVTLDGQDAATFTKYLNFVTVKMKKEHQTGEVTSDEIVITPDEFNRSGNSFSLNYGYKGDTDRSRWLNYLYQVTWSFHGGLEIRTPWKEEDSPMLALHPPYRYRSVTVEGEGETLDEARVRHAVITVSSQIDGKPLLTQATIKNQGPAPSMHLDIPVDVAAENSDVSIKWFLKGGKQVSSPAKQVEGDIIYWDELP